MEWVHRHWNSHRWGISPGLRVEIHNTEEKLPHIGTPAMQKDLGKPSGIA